MPGAYQENLSESAQCSPKTASLFNCHMAGSENPTSLSGQKNNLLSPRSDISEISNMDIDVNKCELPYAYEDSNSETSSDPTISPLTVISLDLDNDNASFRNAHPVLGPELSPLFVDTSLANFTFERFVTGNNLLNFCSQAPGYSVFRSRPPRPKLPGSNVTHFRRRRPVSEYLEYYSRMNSPLCVTVDSLPENSQHYYNEPHTHPQNIDAHQQFPSDNLKPNTDVESVRKWHSLPSVYCHDTSPYFEDQYSPFDIDCYSTYPMCASDKYACIAPGEENTQLIEEMVTNGDCMLTEWEKEETEEGALFHCERPDEAGCFECLTMQSQYHMDTNFTYQLPPIPDNGPIHTDWESQLQMRTHSPSFQSVDVQFVSNPNPYQIMTPAPYFESIPYTQVVQPMICQCDECRQHFMQGVNSYPYYYS